MERDPNERCVFCRKDQFLRVVVVDCETHLYTRSPREEYFPFHLLRVLLEEQNGNTTDRNITILSFICPPLIFVDLVKFHFSGIGLQ